MAKPKAIMAPIDRPLNKAYLREFAGWSTAYAPGLSDPTSMRLMENVLIGRDKSARIRPGLRPIVMPSELIHVDELVQGTFEHFFLNDGRKALLVGVRTANGSTEFRVLAEKTTPLGVYEPAFEVVDFATVFGSASPSFTSDTNYIKYLQIDNKIMALPNSTNAADSVIVFHVGQSKRWVKPAEITVPDISDDAHAPDVVHPKRTTEYPTPTAPVDAETPTSDTLISSGSNNYRYGYYYTFSNEIGESSSSPMTIIRAQRGWTEWEPFKPKSNVMEPSANPAPLPRQAADQIIVTIPQTVYNAAKAAGATRWNLYMTTWSNQDNVPVEGLRVANQEITAGGTWAQEGWARHTMRAPNVKFMAPLPSEDPLLNYNYSAPSHAAQGVVAEDRMVLVNDHQAGAVVRWSSNQLGNYTDFSAARGGGFKTLTHGNLQIAAAVKLWQNPQSVDTITILCMGVDGYSTSYYMAPAEISDASEATPIMGFEETTATPGTTSPFGVEVFNNALYHPLDDQLMKTTANNYAIHHKNMTEQIANKWQELKKKELILSSQLDGRLYYVVNNPDRPEPPPCCMGNEIWVLDANLDTPAWSRFLVSAISLRKIEIGGKLYMSVIRASGIYILDDLLQGDLVQEGGSLVNRPFSWRFETNTQGANRDHSAWAHVQQVNITVGNLVGTFRYGIRSWDVNGKPIDVSKVYRQPNPVDWTERPLPFDHDDYLLIRRGIREWFFFAESEEDEDGNPLPSYGQLSLVQYLFTPMSTNVHGDYGSVETFEYGHAGDTWIQRTSINGVPIPVIDPRRP